MCADPITLTLDASHSTSPAQRRGVRDMWRIGIDIGGTFTDVAMVEADTGRIGIAKVLTTPHDFGQGVIDGIRQGLREQRDRSGATWRCCRTPPPW